MLSATERSDGLFYPSWYKNQTWQPSSPNKTPVTESVGLVSPLIPKEMTVKKVEPPATILKGRIAGTGKETSSSAEMPQVS